MAIKKKQKVVTELIKYILNNIISDKHFQVMLLMSIVMSIKLFFFHRREVTKYIIRIFACFEN